MKGRTIVLDHVNGLEAAGHRPCAVQKPLCHCHAGQAGAEYQPPDHG